MGRLQAGETVELADGATVGPEQVLGPPRPGGRSSSPATPRPAASVLEIAAEADLLVHEATFSEEERSARRRRGTPPRPARPRWRGRRGAACSR